jgi:glycerophosphoryl diester phosphodiesterase
MLVDVAGDLRRSWKDLALTDIAYKLIAFVILAPLVGILFRVIVAALGKSILADQDLLTFFRGPVGWICFIAIGALWIGSVALEQAALLGIVCASNQQKRLGVVQALQFAAAKSRPVILVAARLLALSMLVIAPFAAAAALIYFLLLGEFDINYYLTERPWKFQVACALGAVLITVLAAVLLRLVTIWLFALPLVVFEGTNPSRALRVSGDRTSGHRVSLLLWIGGWIFASIILSSLSTGLVLLLGQWIVPYATGSLWLLTAAVGSTLVLWIAVNLLVNLLSSIAFASLLFHLFRRRGRSESRDLSKLSLTDAELSPTGNGFSRAKLLSLMAVCALLANAIGVLAIRNAHLEDKTTVIAHRGSSKSAPENSLAAIQQSIDDRADWAEIDVQETADGEVVVTHDSDFMRLAGVDLKIWDATMSDLASIDIGSRLDARFKTERVPKLSDVLDLCRGKIGVMIELKYYGHDQQLEQRVADMVDARDMAASVVVMSLKDDAVAKMKAIRPNWKVGLLLSVAAGNLRNLDADFLGVNAAFADRRFIRSAHAAGKEVYVWTVDDAPTMSAMMSRGVDGVITNEPAVARSVLAWRAKMSPAERLLLELAGLFGVVPEIREL